jgi:hypothetical protein
MEHRLDIIETIEGFINDSHWYHYDIGNDVLYLRLRAKLDTTAIGDETEDGLILLRDEKTDQAVGLTVVN